MDPAFLCKYHIVGEATGSCYHEQILAAVYTSFYLSKVNLMTDFSKWSLINISKMPNYSTQLGIMSDKCFQRQSV